MNEIEREKENIEVSHKFILEVVSFSGNVHFSEREILGEENPLFFEHVLWEKESYLELLFTSVLHESSNDIIDREKQS